MKQLRTLCIFPALLMIALMACSCITHAQRSDKTQRQVSAIAISFKNNRVFFKKITLITYRPDETGNGTEGFIMKPFGTVTKQYPPGTRIYFADSKQVEKVMSGRKLDDRPFMVVTPEDSGKTFDIFK